MDSPILTNYQVLNSDRTTSNNFGVNRDNTNNPDQDISKIQKVTIKNLS